MTDLQQSAQQVLELIDLTSLNGSDTYLTTQNLCKNAITPFGNVAAICIYSRFVSTAKKLLNNSNIKVATVTNFPCGLNDIDIALYETQLAISRGADEIDIVFPYHALLANDDLAGADTVKLAKEICGNKTLKVIIETGELKTPELIRLASEISINSGADFIKTSTGKVPINATLEAAEIMLNAIKDSKAKCGFKAAGGVKTVSEAIKYITLAEQIMGTQWVNPHSFRFGASGLLNDVLSILENKQSINRTESTY